MKTLLVKASGTAMVPDFKALDMGLRRFIGRVWDDSHADLAAGIAGGWSPTGQAVEVPARGEYLKAVKDGDLEAADAASASLCGVSFSGASAKKD